MPPLYPLHSLLHLVLLFVMLLIIHHSKRDNRNFIVHLMGPRGRRLSTLRLHSSFIIVADSRY